MRIKFVALFLLVIPFLSAANKTGQWKFDDPTNLLKATVGANLELVGNQTVTNGTSAGDGAIQIGVGSYFKATHGIPKNGGGNYVNEYTIMADIYLPDKLSWRAIFQANRDNTNDAECFIKPTGEVGLASTGYSTYQLNANEWYRLVISVDLGSTYRIYLDGQLALEGKSPAVDGSFSLELDKLLLFADNNGEDGAINVSEVDMWDGPLSESDVSALGGFGHTIGNTYPNPNPIMPFLQSPSSNSATISWHDTELTPDTLYYGISLQLGTSKTSTAETVTTGYIWHTVKLIGLLPDTEYSYKIKGKSGTTNIFKFRTLPLDKNVKKFRFLLIGDTQDNAEQDIKILTKAKDKISSLYGTDFQNQLQAVIHTGDIVGSGSTISQYTEQFFTPFAPFSSSVPFLITAGNHELESPFYYKYIKNDDISAQPVGDSDFERYWSKRIGNTLLIGLNSTDQPSLQGIFSREEAWLKSTLDAAQANDSIAMIFCFVHAHPFSELWVDGSIPFVRDVVFPLLKKYSKVQQLSYGHTHGYERGMATVCAGDSTTGDFTLLDDGGGGGARDRWGVYNNKDYPEIHTSYDYFFYTIGEIDQENNSYKFDVYTLGNDDVMLDNVLLDTWTRKLNQAIPETPVALSFINSTNSTIKLTASPFIGIDSLFSSEFQVIQKFDNGTSIVVVDKIRDIKDIYGVINLIPQNLNKNINLSEYSFSKVVLDNSGNFEWRVRYRDSNQKWSKWSATTSLNLNTELTDPLNASTKITYNKNEKYITISSVNSFNKIEIINTSGSILKTIDNKNSNYQKISTSKYPNGVYFIRIDNHQKKIIL
jgi:hypothetical protein